MSTLTKSLGHTGFRTPRLSWRRLARRLLALDALSRERADLAALNDRMLRDIGVSRSEVTEALRRRDDHLRLILLRGGDQIQH